MGPKPPFALGVLILSYINKIYVKILNEIKINKFNIFHTVVYRYHHMCSNKSQVQVKLYRSYLYMYIFINILISLFSFTHLIYHIFNNFLVCL